MSTPITVIGNLGNVDFKVTPAGKSVLNGSVAKNRSRLNRQTNEWEEIGTDWYRFNIWDTKAETLAEALSKGQRVIVVGTLESREYDKDGTKVTAWEIRATDIGIIPKADSRQAPARGGSAAADDPWATPATSYSDEPPF